MISSRSAMVRSADLVVIDHITRHASIHEVRRGSCAHSSPRCAETLRGLRIVGLTARRALQADGYNIASVSVAVIDRYGRSGHDAAFTIGPALIDQSFGVACLTYLDRLDDAVREELSARIGPMIRQLQGDTGCRPVVRATG